MADIFATKSSTPVRRSYPMKTPMGKSIEHRPRRESRVEAFGFARKRRRVTAWSCLDNQPSIIQCRSMGDSHC